MKQQTKNLLFSKLPNARRHAYRNKHKRFMEGWYYRITLPEENVSFAFIFSIEDPNYWQKNVDGSNLSLAAVQVMGPDDEYLVQADKDHSKFWASEKQQAFGCTFESSQINDNQEMPSSNLSSPHPVIDPEQFHTAVQTGFQMLPTRLQGKVLGHDGSLGGVLEGQGIPRSCEFDMAIRPLSGWGNGKDENQKSTAGWLASFSVFEPHWQVTLADARATGYATWNGKRYEFENVPFYAEKNWGGSFPSKWYWVQCNSFEGYTCPEGISRLSLTAGGGVRKIPFGKTEELGMVCVHLNGIFYEAVPWTGEMEWDVDPWGSWSFSAKCTSGERLFEVQVMAKCDEDGVVLRAPTQDLGLAYFCRDSFYANVELSLYEIYWDKHQKQYVRGNAILEKARSIPRTGAVEIGGGPYWNPWKGKSKMKQPMKALVKLPYMFER
jgi:tocopherol cyclase